MDTYTHRDGVEVEDRWNSASLVWGKIGLRHLEDLHLRTVRKEQGFVRVAAEQGQQQGQCPSLLRHVDVGGSNRMIQDLNTRDGKERSPSAGPFAALNTYTLAAPSSTHTHIHALSYQPDYYTPYSTVTTREHGKRELPVVSPKRRRGSEVNGRSQHQWPSQDWSTRFEPPPASLLVVAAEIGPYHRTERRCD